MAKNRGRQPESSANQKRSSTCGRFLIGCRHCSLQDDIYNQTDPIRHLEATKALQTGHLCTYEKKILPNFFDPCQASNRSPSKRNH